MYVCNKWNADVFWEFLQERHNYSGDCCRFSNECPVTKLWRLQFLWFLWSRPTYAEEAHKNSIFFRALMIVIMKSDCFDKNFIDNNNTFITWNVLHLMVRLFTLIQAILMNKPKLPELPAVAVQRDHHRWEHIMIGSKCIHTQEGGLIVHHSENDDGHLVELYCADLMKAAMRRASWSAPFTASDPARWKSF